MSTSEYGVANVDGLWSSDLVVNVDFLDRDRDLDLKRDVDGARSEHEDCVSRSAASIAASISS